MNIGLDIGDERQIVLTAIMIGIAALGALVNYFLLKRTNERTFTIYGFLKASVFGAAVGFIYAFSTQGGTGIGHWDAAWTAFIMGLGAESIIGKLKGYMDNRALTKTAKKIIEESDAKLKEAEAPKTK